MNSRDRVRAILNRKPVDRFPVDIWHTDEVMKDLQRHTGVTDPLDVYARLGVDKFSWIDIPYLGEMPPKTDPKEEVNLWGVRRKPVRAGKATYLEFCDFPFAGFDSIAQLEDYPWWPDPDRFDYDRAVADARRASERFTPFGPCVSFFEQYCWMRGLEQSLTDVLTDSDFVHAALDRIEAVQTEMLRRFLDHDASVTECVIVSDDMGTQESLILSLDVWDEFLKPRLGRWCRLIHDYGVKVFYHSDGACAPLIPRLIEAGIDILNPIQHTCPGMDMAGLKAAYGDCLIFHGGIDTQRMLPFGTPDDVRHATREALRALGADGQGYICCSCHNIQAGTPVENILAMIETVREGFDD